MDQRLEIPVDETYYNKLDELMKKYKIQYYNARFGSALSTSLSINTGNMKSSHIFNNYGFSIQTFINGGYGFAVSNSITLNELEKKFEESAKLALFASKKAEKKFKMIELDPITIKFERKQEINLLDISPDEKIKYLMEQDTLSRKFDERIVSTNSIYGDVVSHQKIITSDKRIIDLTEAYTRILIFAYSKQEEILQAARSSSGITGGFEITKNNTDLGNKAAKDAIEMLNAKPVKGGKYNVIIDPLLTGTFIHEAFGHACEADGVLAGESQLSGMLGKKVGKDFINVYEDPTLEKEYGSIIYDSEGVKTKKLQLIKNGILNEFMHNRETASKMSVEPTGNGRAQSYRSTPVVRMRNTYMDSGDWTLEEMTEDLKNGLICISWNYGYTTPSIGQFMFKMERAWEIKNGEKKQLLRDAALSGIMLESLNKIDAISNAIELDDGTCGKSGQHAPVSSGGPYVKMNDVVIGGV